jgi:hypothetical protein
MKVGDLVRVAPHCKNKGRVAIVMRTETWEPNGVWIKYLDGKPAGAYIPENGYAMKDNLEVISESR